MRISPIPRAIQTPWEDLLTKRALLHEHLKTFRDGRHFIAKSTSMRMSDRRDAAALERFAEEVFNVFVDLGREWLAASHPEHDGAVRDLPAEGVLVQLREQRVISATVFEDMDAIRETRNSWQHGASFVPAAAVWRGVTETERAIDKALSALQRAFEGVGFALELDFPDLETDA